MIEVLYSGPATLEGPRSAFGREEHRMKELGLLRGTKRAPRRSQTQHEYYFPQWSTSPAYTIRQHPARLPAPSVTPGEQEVEEPRSRSTRPPLGPPRRSYSVSDREPIPHHHRPSARLALMDLPAELHYAIFDFLDPIDSTCLGLTNRHFYTIHRRLHGTVPLSTRRVGPNELEWAWHQAGKVTRTNATAVDGQEAAPPPAEQKNSLSSLRIRGQVYCRQCGITRCQLHKHIKEWMGKDLEYCSVKERYGPVAPEGAKPFCYMSKPGDPQRCGRHFVRKNKVVLQ
ncbi:hypothetical protein VTK56DRAFT_6237 [Thermocarpiscus australiensis]